MRNWIKKNLMWLAAIGLSVCLAGCGREPFQLDQAFTPYDSWPENEFTAVLPEPETGAVESVYDGSADGRYAILLQDMTQEASEGYLETLRDAGFMPVSEESEPEASGTVLYRDGVYLSVAYSGDGMSLLITLEDGG